MANRTVHSIMHIGWVPDGTGGQRGQIDAFDRPRLAGGRRNPRVNN
jgi:hypothetical protein